jgi:L-threonylcarbamoyladenylate synthase
MPVLEGGASEVGIESTILDLSRLDRGAGPVLLRPGHISAAQIEAVLGVQVFAPDAAAPRASGTLKAHYAPRTALELASDARLQAALQGRGLPPGKVVVVAYTPPPAAVDARIQWQQVPADPARYAQALYALLRDLDGQGFARIIVQAPPDSEARSRSTPRTCRGGRPLRPPGIPRSWPPPGASAPGIPPSIVPAAPAPP